MRNPSNPSNYQSDSSSEIIPDGVDFISSLPDAILHDILSYIPTKSAVRTSVLSKRWTRVWHGTSSISIYYNTKDHTDSIDKILKSPLKIKSFRLRFGICDRTMLAQRWIEHAMSRNAENLSLEYISHNGFFPDFNPKWTSLRNLSLNRGYYQCGEFFDNILSGCPMLESLILYKCLVFGRLDLSKSVNLRKIEIINVIGEDMGPDEIVAPHIQYLSLTNFHELDTFVDLLSLTDAKFNIDNFSYRLSDADSLQAMVLKMLAKLQNLDKLTVGVVVLQILSLAEVRGVPFPQLKIKSLTLETMLVRSVIPGIIRLLQNSPELKNITLHTTNCKAIGDKKLHRYLDKQGLDSGRRWDKFFPTVKATSSSLNSRHVALFMELVMCKARTLETMVLRLGGYLSATEYQNLLSLVSRSRDKNLRKYGQGKAILNSFKIFP